MTAPGNAFAGLRSLLFVPMDDAGRAQRAFGRWADAVILDLEDGVAPAYEEAVRDGRGALTVRGKMIDLPVVARARATLAQGDLVGAAGEEER